MRMRELFGAACTKVEFEYLLYRATEPEGYEPAYWQDAKRLGQYARAQSMLRFHASLKVLAADYDALPIHMWDAARRDHDRRVYG